MGKRRGGRRSRPGRSRVGAGGIGRRRGIGNRRGVAGVRIGGLHGLHGRRRGGFRSRRRIGASGGMRMGGGAGAVAFNPFMLPPDHPEYEYHMNKIDENYKNKNKPLIIGILMLVLGVALIITAVVVAAMGTMVIMVLIPIAMFIMVSSCCCFFSYNRIKNMKSRKDFYEQHPNQRPKPEPMEAWGDPEDQEVDEDGNPIPIPEDAEDDIYENGDDYAEGAEDDVKVEDEE